MVANSRADRASAAWYGSARWKRRRRAQLLIDPFCAMCLEQSGVYVLASVADHVEPHRENAERFWFGPLQSLCATHHSRDKQLIEHGQPLLGVDVDGWPVGKP